MNVKVYNNASEEHLKHSMVLFINTEGNHVYLDKEYTHPVTGNEIVDVLEALVAGQLVFTKAYDDDESGDHIRYVGRPINACVESNDVDNEEAVYIYYVSSDFGRIEAVTIELPNSTGLFQKFSDMIMPK